MRAEILSIGTELLMGQIANTDAEYISKKLPEVGIGVFYHTVVGDNPGRVEECLKLALSRADVVITTGGLGPTQDDLTKETIAKVLGLSMKEDADSIGKIKEYFKRRGSLMTENNLRQGNFPEGAIILKNETGTAPGCVVTTGDSKYVIMLPGPPKELKPMFDNEVMPFLKEKAQKPLVSKFVRVVGVGESSIEEKLMCLIDGQTNPTFATYAKDGNVTIRVTASDEEGNGNELLDEAVGKIKDILGDAVYSTDDEELVQVVLNMLKERNLEIACAESCTGGALAKLITACPGASEVFHTGLVTYSEDSKMKLLGVKKETLDKYTVYSEQVAGEMAEGLQKLTGAGVCVSITGVAGPGGGTEETPVGTVFIGVKYKEKLSVTKHCFAGIGRDRVRVMSVVNSLNNVRKEMLLDV